MRVTHNSDFLFALFCCQNDRDASFCTHLKSWKTENFLKIPPKLENWIMRLFWFDWTRYCTSNKQIFQRYISLRPAMLLRLSRCWSGYCWLMSLITRLLASRASNLTQTYLKCSVYELQTRLAVDVIPPPFHYVLWFPHLCNYFWKHCIREYACPRNQKSFYHA